MYIIHCNSAVYIIQYTVNFYAVITSIHVFQNESKHMPKMSSFLTKLADYNTSLQMKKTTDGVGIIRRSDIHRKL